MGGLPLQPPQLKGGLPLVGVVYEQCYMGRGVV